MAVRWLLEDALGKVKALQEAAGTLKLLPYWQRMSLCCEHPVALLQASTMTVLSADTSASGPDAQGPAVTGLLPKQAAQVTRGRLSQHSLPENSKL